MSNKIKDALDVINDALKNDKEYYLGWQSNIAMSFYDKYVEFYKDNNRKKPTRQEIAVIANKGAITFLEKLASEL